MIKVCRTIAKQNDRAECEERVKLRDNKGLCKTKAKMNKTYYYKEFVSAIV
jgi:hypothetical protein